MGVIPPDDPGDHGRGPVDVNIVGGGGGGDATAANQTTEIALLTSIDSKIVDHALTNVELRASAVPVSGTVTSNTGTDVASTFKHGQNTDIDSGADEQIVVATNAATRGVVIKAMPENTGIIYIGLSGVTSTTGFPLEAGETVTIPVDDADKIYALASIDNQALAWIAV